MKKIIINSKKHGKKEVLIDDEDFELVSTYKWYFNKRAHTFYAKATINGKTTGMHRFLLQIKDKNLVADHKDRNGLNNQRSNLRVAIHAQNSANRKPTEGSTSKYLGVWKYYGKYWAKIKEFHLGEFKTEKAAARAYDEKAKEIYG